MSKPVWYIYFAAIAIYLSLTFLVPTDPAILERYDITPMQAELLKLTVVLPLMGVWFAAFYGYDRFKRYAQTIETAPDGRAFGHLADGLGVLAFSLPATSIVTSVLSMIARDSPDALPATTIISNYLAIALALAAFWLIYKGATGLSAMIPKAGLNGARHRAVLVSVATLGVVYAYFAFQNPIRQAPSEAVERATHYLPDWLLLFTVIIPYLFIWYIGLRAAVAIIGYTRSVSGVLYRQPLIYAAKGIAAIIGFSMVLQFMTNFTASLLDLSLAPLLGIIYLLLAAIAIGYVYVAVGARKLQKIEEV